MRDVVTTPDAPSSPLFSQAVKAGGFVFVSGLVGLDVETGALAGDTIVEQTRQALANCDAVLRAAGAGPTTSSRSACCSRARPTSRA